jgi:hypothetical protein
MTEVNTNISERINQGDIFKDVEYIEKVEIIDNEVIVSKITFPLVVVLTQDCDLQQDSAYRVEDIPSPSSDNSKLFSVIVAPLYNEDMFLAGEHLNDNKTITMKMQEIPKYSKKNKISSQYSNLVKNETPRYHHLSFPNEVGIVNSVIDFKHYFTVNIDYLMKNKETKFICKIAELYREHVSQRFAFFLSRIGLPNK